MRTRVLLIAASAAALLAAGVIAAEVAKPTAPAVLGSGTPAATANTSGMPHYDGPASTRQEAIKRAEARVEALKKMSDKEWQERQSKRKAMREKFRNMSPEQRKAYRQQRGGTPQPAPTAAPVR